MSSSSCFRQVSILCVLCCLFLALILFNRILNGYEYRARPSLQSSDDSYEPASYDALPPSIELIMEQIQLTRRNLIDESCRKILWRRQSRPARFYVDHRHKLMYCYVPKVASTNLKRMMLILSGMVETKNLFSIPRNMVHEENRMQKLEPYSTADIIRHGMGNYTKLIFVRHPFERLISAYYDKFVDKNNTVYQLGIGTGIVRKYRPHPSELSLKNGHDITIPEFISYVIDEWKDGRRQLDVHWRPMVDLCLPCSIDYDIIGKLETLNHDVEFLLKKLNESSIIKLFQLAKPPSTTSSMKQFINQLSQQQLIDLFHVYEDDFRIFGYE